MRHRMAWVLVLALFALGLPPPAHAQEWPQRPVRIIVPFPAGGNSDAVARIIAQRLGEVFGQQFVVESRPGAGGALAAESVARAPADGYTLFMATLGQIAVIPKISKAPTIRCAIWCRSAISGPTHSCSSSIQACPLPI